MKPKTVQAFEMFIAGKTKQEIADHFGWSRAIAHSMVSNGKNYKKLKKKQRSYYEKFRAKPIKKSDEWRPKRNETLIGLYQKFGAREAARIANVSPNVVAGVVHRWRHAQ